MARTKDARNTLGELDAKAVTRLVGAASDIALVLDDEGTIIEVVTQRDELGARGTREWLGRPWVQTVTDRKPAEGRGAAARRAGRGRRGRALAPGQPSGQGRRRPAAAVFDDARGAGRRAQRQGPHRRLRPRPARQRGAAASPGRSAAGDGARLLALSRGRDALPPPVRDHGRGGADRRRLHAEGARGQPGRAHAVRHAPRPAGRGAAGGAVRADACRAAAEPAGRGPHRRPPGRAARASWPTAATR